MSKKVRLRMKWSKKENDYEFHYDKSASDGAWLSHLVQAGVCSVLDRQDLMWQSEERTKAFREELLRRGFDPDTFKIQVKRLDPKTRVPEERGTLKDLRDWFARGDNLLNHADDIEAALGRKGEELEQLEYEKMVKRAEEAADEKTGT